MTDISHLLQLTLARLDSLDAAVATTNAKLDALHAHALFELTGRIVDYPKMVQFLASIISPLAFAGIGTIVEFWHSGDNRFDPEFTTFIYVYKNSSESIGEHPLMISLEAAADKDLVIPSDLADSYVTSKFPNVLQMAEVGYERGGIQLAFKPGTSMAEAVETATAVFREFFSQRIPRACKLFQLDGNLARLECNFMAGISDESVEALVDRKSRGRLPEFALCHIGEWDI